MAVFALVDANNFYATCEKIFQPALRDVPVVVLSNNDGCIVARSAEAKALGIPMGAPIHEWKDFCHQHQVVIKSSNYVLYGDLSARMLKILQEHAPDVESYSIDESFIELSGFNDLTERGRAMRADVLKRIHVTCGVGIGPSKTLAKFANHIAKKRPEWNGVFNTLDQQEAFLDDLMQQYPVTEVWGVGHRLGQHLEALGIKTVLDLKNASTRDIRDRFNVVLERTVRELNGQSCLELEQVVPDKQQIISSRSFGRMVYGLDDLQAAVSHFMARAAEKLRRQGSVCRVVTVGVRSNPFRAQDIQYRNYQTVALVVPSSDTRTLTQAALKGLKYIYKPGIAYKKASVVLTGITPASQVQNDLFATSTDPKKERLMAVFDEINQRHGRGTMKLASEGLSHRWRMRVEEKSPRYTTCWEELAVVRSS